MALHLTCTLRGGTPNSPYTMLLYVHLFTDKIYLQKRSCILSKMTQSSGAHTSQLYNTIGR